MGKSNRLKNRMRQIGAPCLIGAFFCFLFLYYGIGQYPDTITYINASIDREPIYPILLRCFRILFTQEHYLTVAALAQNLFAAVVTWCLYRYVSARFSLSGWARGMAVLVLLAPHLLTASLTTSGIILTNAILSEGITVTLYQLFFLLLLRAVLEQKHKRYAGFALLIALLNMLTRGQMMVMPLIWMVVLLAYLLTGAVMDKKAGNVVKKERKLRESRAFQGILVIGLTLVCFLLRTVLVSSYNEVVNGYYHGNTSGNMTLLTNVLYSADAEDGADIEDAELRQLFEKSYQEMQAQQMTYADAEAGIFSHVHHHEDCHDRIKFNILDSQIRQYVEQHYGVTESNLEKIYMDEVAGTLMKEILPKCIGNWIRTYLYVICGGFIRTVAILHPLLGIYAVLIYIVAIAGMWYLFRKGTSKEPAVFMLMILVMIVANVCATGMTIMCLSRYMIYNMSLFYLAGVVMLQEIVRTIKSSSEHNTE